METQFLLTEKETHSATPPLTPWCFFPFSLSDQGSTLNISCSNSICKCEVMGCTLLTTHSCIPSILPRDPMFLFPDACSFLRRFSSVVLMNLSFLSSLLVTSLLYHLIANHHPPSAQWSATSNITIGITASSLLPFDFSSSLPARVSLLSHSS